MPTPMPIGLRCRIARGGFSGERIVYVTQADGSELKGLAPTHYCWTRDGRPLNPNEPPDDETVEGIVAARYLGERGEGAVVTIPDGEVFLVKRDQITERPTTEPPLNVSLRPGPALGT